jgi:hypothetical protein
MKKTVHTCIVLLTSLLPLKMMHAQGITRAQGLGLRLSSWNITGRRTTISVDGMNGNTQVDLSGMGPTIYYFSRAYRNLYLETSLGVIGGVVADAESAGKATVSVESIVPFVVGLRYDFMGMRISGALHPYLAAGGGPYSVFNVKTSSDAETAFTGQETIQTRMDYGWFFGGGVNFTLTNWFTLNADLKYHSIKIPDLKDYSGLELGIGLAVMWGRQLEVYEIKQVRLVMNDIYPAYQQFYTTFPIALVSVENLAGHPIEVNINGLVKGYSQRKKESGFISVKAGETKDIPVTVYFNRKLLEHNGDDTVILDMEVEVRTATMHRETLSAPIVIHSRNAWNGDMAMLPRFLTPEAEEVRSFSGKVVLGLGNVETGLENFSRASALFDALSAMNIRYLPDPNIPFYQDDRVQFAEETLQIRSGDCDDLAVLYASLLESVGIETAFVEVQNPDAELAHIYLLFNSGLTAADGFLLTDNEKRYILRENSTGQSMIWIPVETTLLAEGFQQAWNTAALDYLQEGVLGNGLADGWVKVIDNH